MSTTSVSQISGGQAGNAAASDNALVHRGPVSGGNQEQTTFMEGVLQPIRADERELTKGWLSWLRSLVMPRWVGMCFLIIARDVFGLVPNFDAQEPHYSPTSGAADAPRHGGGIGVRIGDNNKDAGNVSHSGNEIVYRNNGSGPTTNGNGNINQADKIYGSGQQSTLNGPFN